MYPNNRYFNNKIWLVVLLLLSLFSLGTFANQGLWDAVEAGNIKQIKTLLKQNIDPNTTQATGDTALHLAAYYQHTAVVKTLLKSGANPNSINRYGISPTYITALNGDAEIMRLLLNAGADTAYLAPTTETLLMIAARTGEPKLIKLLLSRGADVNAREQEFKQSALMLAVRGNHLQAVKLLIDAGADNNAQTRIGPTPIFIPPCKGTGCGSEGVGINRGGIPDRGRRDATKGGMTPLLYAAREGFTDAAAQLIKAGADVELAEANGISPLLMALLNNQLGVANLLLDHGADVNSNDFWGRTPLWAAVEYRNLDMNNREQDDPVDNGVQRETLLPVIQRLLELGANVNARTREVFPSRKWLYSLNDVSWVDFTGQTPFLRAALSGDVTTMELLLKYGADTNIPTFAGTTPLMAAAGVNWVVAQTYTESEQSLIDAIALCLEHGADINASNSMGLTAVLGAANRGANDILRFLANNGADLHVADVHGRTPQRWAEGVFLAAVGATRKPETLTLLDELLAAEKVESKQ